MKRPRLACLATLAVVTQVVATATIRFDPAADFPHPKDALTEGTLLAAKDDVLREKARAYPALAKAAIALGKPDPRCPALPGRGGRVLLQAIERPGNCSSCCYCPPGFYFNGQDNVPCPVDEYCPGGWFPYHELQQGSAPIPCPQGRSTCDETGAQSPADCACPVCEPACAGPTPICADNSTCAACTPQEAPAVQGNCPANAFCRLDGSCEAAQCSTNSDCGGLITPACNTVTGLCQCAGRGDGFQSYALGNINLQNGWTTQDAFTSCQNVGTWDQAITTANGVKVWRLSNAITNSGYSAQPFSPLSPLVAGESGASLWNDRGTNGCSPVSPPRYGANATMNKFYSRIDFRSATGAAQIGLGITISASAKQSTVRMTYLRIYDDGAGFSLSFIDEVDTIIATGLSYTDLHTIEMTIDFVPGVNNVGGVITGNDIVKVYLDGTLIHTGTTWEAYYYENELIIPGVPRLQAVNSLLFRSSGTAVVATSGKGFYFEDVVLRNCLP